MKNFEFWSSSMICSEMNLLFDVEATLTLSWIRLCSYDIVKTLWIWHCDFNIATNNVAFIAQSELNLDPTLSQNWSNVVILTLSRSLQHRVLVVPRCNLTTTLSQHYVFAGSTHRVKKSATEKRANKFV